MASRDKELSKERQISDLLNVFVNSDTEESVRSNSTKIMKLLSSDPKYLDICFRRPDFLGTRIKVDWGSTTFGHGIALGFPEESLVLFDHLKNNPQQYLPVLQSRNSGGWMVGATIVGSLLDKDEALSLFDNILRADLKPVGLGEHLGVELTVPVPKKSILKMKLIEAIKDNPEMESILKMVGNNDASVAHRFSVDSYLAIELIELIKKKPFFAKILDLQADDSIKVWMALLTKCERIDKMMEALETTTPEIAKQILESRPLNDDNYLSIAHVLAQHPHSAIKLKRLIGNNPELAGTRELTVQTGEESITVDQMLRKSVIMVQ